MTVGGSIALIVIGAILRFAISFSPAYVNLRLVGLIVMIGGIIGLIISLAFMTARRRRPPPSRPAPARSPRRLAAGRVKPQLPGLGAPAAVA